MPFFSKTCDYAKLRSHLQLCNNRLDTKQKKKESLGARERQEIAGLLKINKIDRARIKTEQIIRDDYLCGVLDILRTYCELLVARFGIFENRKVVDDSLEQAIATLIWCTPRLSCEIPELVTIKQQFEAKYSKDYVDACLENKLGKVNNAVVQKLSLSAPPSSLVEKYMVEIASTYKVDYEPDPRHLEPTPGQVLVGFGESEDHLINFEPIESKNLPSLPSGFASEAEHWEHGNDLGPDAPYPEESPFPRPGEGPPIPQEPPATGGPTDYFGYKPPSPPPYDSAMFPEKPGDNPSTVNPHLNPPASTVGQDSPPGYSPDVQGPTTTGARADDPDFDELQRRFNQLTNRK